MTATGLLRPHDRVSWSALPVRAKVFRVAHLGWGVVGMASLGWIWWAALRGRRDRYLYGAMAFLSVEGAALVVGRGDCPFGPFQTRLGDPVPMFELFLSPRAAKAAVPVLAAAGLAGTVVALMRSAARR